MGAHQTGQTQGGEVNADDDDDDETAFVGNAW